MRKALALLVVLSLLLSTLYVAVAESANVGFKLPARWTFTATFSPSTTKANTVEVLWTPQFDGNFTIMDVEPAVPTASVKGIFINGVKVSTTAPTPSTDVKAGKAVNITIVLSDTVPVSLTLEYDFLLPVSGSLSYAYPAKNATLSLSFSLSPSFTTSGIQEPQHSLTAFTPFDALQITVQSVTGGSITNAGVVTSDVEANSGIRGSNGAYYGGFYVSVSGLQFSASVSLLVKPRTLSTLATPTVKVEGFNVPSGVQVLLSNNIAVTAPNATLTIYFNGSTAKPGYGHFSVEAAGFLNYNLRHPFATYVAQVSVPVYHNAGDFKYYALVYNVTQKEGWFLKSKWGLAVIQLKVGSDVVDIDPSFTNGSYWVLPFVNVTWISLPGVSLSYNVNDTARQVLVTWNNSAYKVVTVAPVSVNVKVDSKKPPKYTTQEIYWANNTIYSADPAATISGGKLVTLSSGKLFVAKLGDQVLRVSATGSYKTVAKTVSAPYGNKPVTYVIGSSISGKAYLPSRLFVVVSSPEQMVQGAKVSLYNATTNMLIESRYTDSNGVAQFITVYGATYIVEVDSAGEVHTFTVTAGDADQVVEVSVSQAPPQPIITFETAILIVLVLATVMLLLFAYYVISNRRAVVIE